MTAVTAESDPKHEDGDNDEDDDDETTMMTMIVSTNHTYVRTNENSANHTNLTPTYACGSPLVANSLYLCPRLTPFYCELAPDDSRSSLHCCELELDACGL